jgi:hypothetical protein
MPMVVDAMGNHTRAVVQAHTHRVRWLLRYFAVGAVIAGPGGTGIRAAERMACNSERSHAPLLTTIPFAHLTR